MSASSSSLSLAFATQQVVIYVGIFLFIAGLIGEPLVLLVFVSLRTFRESSCAFYLSVVSMVNTLYLFTGLLTFIMINGFTTSWTNMSLFYCKFRPFSVQLCALTSFTCMCLATIDQFLATCSDPRWHRWNNIKLARYIVTGVFIIWLLHGIPFLLYYNELLSPATSQNFCTITNTMFQQYNSFFYFPILAGALPVIMMILFGILAYRNVQQITYRTVPLVRRELDKQLTMMVLVQVFSDIFVLIPISVQNFYSLIINPPSSSVAAMEQGFIRSILTILFYFRFVSPFYIYMCVSKRFRQQLIHVLFTVHLNRWCPRRMINNQVEPQT